MQLRNGGSRRRIGLHSSMSLHDRVRSMYELDGAAYRTHFFLRFLNPLSAISKVVTRSWSLNISWEDLSSSWENDPAASWN